MFLVCTHEKCVLSWFLSEEQACKLLGVVPGTPLDRALHGSAGLKWKTWNAQPERAAKLCSKARSQRGSVQTLTLVPILSWWKNQRRSSDPAENEPDQRAGSSAALRRSRGGWVLQSLLKAWLNHHFNNNNNHKVVLILFVESFKSPRTEVTFFYKFANF